MSKDNVSKKVSDVLKNVGDFFNGGSKDIEEIKVVKAELWSGNNEGVVILDVANRKALYNPSGIYGDVLQAISESIKWGYNENVETNMVSWQIISEEFEGKIRIREDKKDILTTVERMMVEGKLDNLEKKRNKSVFKNLFK